MSTTTESAAIATATPPTESVPSPSSSENYIFEITHGKNVISIELDGEKTVKDLKEDINTKTKVPASLQKLLFKSKEKPNLKDENLKMKDLGLKPGVKCKVLLVGSSLESVISGSKPSEKKKSSSSSSSSEPQSPVSLKLSQLPVRFDLKLFH